jgi:hypothetical protein
MDLFKTRTPCQSVHPVSALMGWCLCHWFDGKGYRVMSDTKDETRRINDILSSVVIFLGLNKQSTTDCYMKYPDNSVEWIQFNETDFMDTLSFCLDATISGNNIYCRQYINRKKQIIKLETPIIITPNDFRNFISSICMASRWVFYYNSPDHKMKTENLITSHPCFAEAFISFCSDKITKEAREQNVNDFYKLFVEDSDVYVKNKYEFSILNYADQKIPDLYNERPIIISEYIILQIFEEKYNEYRNSKRRQINNGV